MAAAHHGHIICLYAGRAVYCPKMATLPATLKAALECLGLENGREVHFAFPHSDLAILVEISPLAFKNVRDGAILYLCDGDVGPVYPYDLAFHAQQGRARRPARAVSAAPADGPAPAAGADGTGNNAARGSRAAENGRRNMATNARVTRSSRRLQRQANDAAHEEDAATAANDKETPQGPPAETATVPLASSSSSSAQSSAGAAGVKREAIEEDEEDDGYLARGYEADEFDEAIAENPYFKRRRLAH